MGADAFWFCDTCRVIYQPKAYSGRNYLGIPAMYSEPPITWQEVDSWINQTKKLVTDFDGYGEWYGTRIPWFEELRDFLKRHEGHPLLLTSDFSCDLNAGEFKDSRGLVWDRFLDYVSEGQPKPEYPKYSTGWHAMVGIERLKSSKE